MLSVTEISRCIKNIQLQLEIDTKLLENEVYLEYTVRVKPNKAVLEPLVSSDLAVYILSMQVKVKMTLDLVMSPWSMSNMKLLIVYLWLKFTFSCNKSESVYEEFEDGDS